MKKILMFASLLTVTAALSSCISTGLVTLSDITFTSNFTATINNQTRFVVCNDRQTSITYSFRVSGVNYLSYWETVFVGKNTGTTIRLPNYTLANFVANGDRVTVTTDFTAGSAPSSVSNPNSRIQPRAVVVVPAPAATIGATDLNLTVHDTQGGSVSGRISDFTNTIPVISSCI
jgi:hypothetical protein